MKKNATLATVIALERLAAMAAALPTLSAKEATCLQGELNGRSYPEIAAAIGGTKKAVALAVDRGRRKLAAAAELGVVAHRSRRRDRPPSRAARGIRI